MARSNQVCMALLAAALVVTSLAVLLVVLTDRGAAPAAGTASGRAAPAWAAPAWDDDVVVEAEVVSVWVRPRGPVAARYAPAGPPPGRAWVG